MAEPGCGGDGKAVVHIVELLNDWHEAETDEAMYRSIAEQAGCSLADVAVAFHALGRAVERIDAELTTRAVSPAREAFCEMLHAYPGPDATRYIGWARSSDHKDAEKLLGYVRQTIGAIEHVGEDEERVHLPMLRTLLAELVGECS